jgi:hypothetical protein
MRILVLSLPLALAAAFLLGRASSPSPAAGASATHVYTGRLYDVFRVPAASLRCDVNAEAGSTYLSCEHVPFSHARHEVTFFAKNIFVYRVGHPDNPVWTARGRP